VEQDRLQNISICDLVKSCDCDDLLAAHENEFQRSRLTDGLAVWRKNGERFARVPDDKAGMLIEGVQDPRNLSLPKNLDFDTPFEAKTEVVLRHRLLPTHSLRDLFVKFT
jgi:hypothetical protein